MCTRRNEAAWKKELPKRPNYDVIGRCMLMMSSHLVTPAASLAPASPCRDDEAMKIPSIQANHTAASAPMDRLHEPIRGCVT